MRETDPKARIARLERALNIPSGTLRADQPLRGLEGWDSLKLLELLVAAEEAFRVELNEEEVVNCVTVGDLMRLLEKQEQSGN